MTVYLIVHDGPCVSSFGNAPDDKHVYAIGKLPPNYPLPAIPITAIITPRGVMIWRLKAR